jgi:hypothetical protein
MIYSVFYDFSLVLQYFAAQMLSFFLNPLIYKIPVKLTNNVCKNNLKACYKAEGSVLISFLDIVTPSLARGLLQYF